MSEPDSPPRRIVRSRTDRVFAGVCGGLADYLDQDSTLVRIAWVVVTLLAPPAGLLAYLLLWLLAPEEGDLQPQEETGANQQGQTLTDDSSPR